MKPSILFSRSLTFLICILVGVTGAATVHASDKARFCKAMRYWDDSRDGKTGEEICRSGNGVGCTGVDAGEGICRAGDGVGCTGVSIGEGICRAGNGVGCTGVSIGEGICRAGNGVGCTGVSEGEGLCRAVDGSGCTGMDFATGRGLVRDFCGQ